MPIVLPQSAKAISTINAQPDRLSERMRAMILMDVGGASGKTISEVLGMVESRVSIIRNTPLYQQALAIERARLESTVIEKHATKLTEGDPTRRYLASHSLEAAKAKVSLMREAASEFVRSSAADSILDRTGYGVRHLSTNVNIEVTEKMFARFEKALLYQPPTAPDQCGAKLRDGDPSPVEKGTNGSNVDGDAGSSQAGAPEEVS